MCDGPRLAPCLVFVCTTVATETLVGVEVVTTGLEVQPDATAAWYDLLSDTERSRANRFASGRDRRRFIVARARLRQLLGERLRVPAAAVELSSGPNGKPALAGRFACSDLRFNTSHCEDVAAYAFAQGREVGIDIERVRVMSDADTLASRFFSDDERAAYEALPPAGRPLGFFESWTRKEAFIKALGEGLDHPFDDIDTRQWQMMRFAPAPGFVGALVIERRPAWQQQ